MSDAAIGMLVIAVLGVAIAVGCVWFWAAMLVNAAKNGKWVWFVMVLVIPLLCLLYVLIGYRRVERGVTYRDAHRIEPEL